MRVCACAGEAGRHKLLPLALALALSLGLLRWSGGLWRLGAGIDALHGGWRVSPMRGQCLRLWCASDLVRRCWTDCSAGRRQSGIASIANSGAIGEASYQLGVGSAVLLGRACAIEYLIHCSIVLLYSCIKDAVLDQLPETRRCPLICARSGRATC